MKKTAKLSGMVFFISLLCIPTVALAVATVVGGSALRPISEPAFMLLLGTGLIGMASFWRKTLPPNKKRDRK